MFLERIREKKKTYPSPNALSKSSNVCPEAQNANAPDYNFVI
jgi:hypothetical protein